MKAKKDTKQLLFENMAKLNPSFKKINEYGEPASPMNKVPELNLVFEAEEDENDTMPIHVTLNGEEHKFMNSVFNETEFPKSWFVDTWKKSPNKGTYYIHMSELPKFIEKAKVVNPIYGEEFEKQIQRTLKYVEDVMNADNKRFSNSASPMNEGPIDKLFNQKKSLKKIDKKMLLENMVKLNPDLKITPKGRLLAKRRLNESGPFNDAGEPNMTHQQYRDYSEPSEPEFDDRDDYEREQTLDDVVEALQKHFNTILEDFGDDEYIFMTNNQVNGDMMVWLDKRHQIGAIGPDDKRFQEQDLEELDINELIQFFEPYRQYILSGPDAEKEMDSRSRQASADAQYARQERAAMGGLGEEEIPQSTGKKLEDMYSIDEIVDMGLQNIGDWKIGEKKSPYFRGEGKNTATASADVKLPDGSNYVIDFENAIDYDHDGSNETFEIKITDGTVDTDISWKNLYDEISFEMEKKVDDSLKEALENYHNY